MNGCRLLLTADLYSIRPQEICSHWRGCVTKITLFCSRAASKNPFRARGPGRASFFFLRGYRVIGQNSVGVFTWRSGWINLLRWGAAGRGCQKNASVFIADSAELVAIGPFLCLEERAEKQKAVRNGGNRDNFANSRSSLVSNRNTSSYYNSSIVKWQ